MLDTDRCGWLPEPYDRLLAWHFPYSPPIVAGTEVGFDGLLPNRDSHLDGLSSAVEY
jgi:hypothetical protein